MFIYYIYNNKRNAIFLLSKNDKKLFFLVDHNTSKADIIKYQLYNIQ